MFFTKEETIRQSSYNTFNIYYHLHTTPSFISKIHFFIIKYKYFKNYYLKKKKTQNKGRKSIFINIFCL